MRRVSFSCIEMKAVAYIVFLQQIPEDETILCMKTFISNVLLHISFGLSNKKTDVCVYYMYTELHIFFFFSSRSLFPLLIPGDKQS